MDMTEQTTLRKPARRRVIKVGLWMGLILGLIATGGCLCAFRDRHPGYSLALDVAREEPDAADLKVGFGRVNITPDISDPKKPIWIAGFSQNRAATGIHDDLWALACVIDDGRKRLAVVALDAIGFFHDDVIVVRSRLDPELRLDYTIVCSTHNHSTPDLMGLWGPSYLKTGVSQAYRELVISAAVDAVTQAAGRLEPAKVAFSRIPTPSEGLVEDKRKPEVFDPDIRLMQFVNPTNELTIGTIITWASHPETVWSKNTEITADFPGYLRATLEKGLTYRGVLLEPGLGGTHLYINGAIGGLMTTGPGVTVRDPYLQQDFKEPSHEKAAALGRNLAQRILGHLEKNDAPAVADATLAIRAQTMEIPLQNLGYLVAPVLGLIDRGQVRWKHIRSEVALVEFGEVSIACIPGEIYPELVNGGVVRAPGADFDIDPVEVPPIRELMPGKIKFVFGLANDEIGYIIPKSEWDKKSPYLYGSKKRVYGEVNSCGPEVAARIHEVFKQWGGASPPR